MELNEAIGYALDGHAVLFTGAGFSRGAKNIRGSFFRTGSELADHFAKEAGLSSGIELDDAAEAFADRLGADRLIKELQEDFTVRDLLPVRVKDFETLRSGL